jgi:hypothetical protein
MAVKLSRCSSSSIGRKKRPLRNNTRAGSVSLDQFHSQLQQLVVGSSDRQSEPSLGGLSPPVIRFTESAVHGLREIFGTYLQHVASALSNHDSLTKEETIIDSLTEVVSFPSTTGNYITPKGDAACRAWTSSSVAEWQLLPQQAKELLAEAAIAADAGGRRRTTLSARGIGKPGKITSSLLMLQGTNIETTAATATTSTAQVSAERNQKKKRKRMMVTEAMEAEQEQLLMASKKSMVEKQKESNT